jgi:hypothetical protein
MCSNRKSSPVKYYYWFQNLQRIINCFNFSYKYLPFKPRAIFILKLRETRLSRQFYDNEIRLSFIILAKKFNKQDDI